MGRTTRNEFRLIAEIAEKAQDYLEFRGVSQTRLDLMMDLEFINDDMPLDLERMCKARMECSGDFAHDIAGIHDHWNRQTKHMDDHFVPRFTR